MVDIGIVSLSACSGCQIALLDHKEILAKILPEIRYATTIYDQRELPELDFCLVEGAVRTVEDLERLREAREKSKVLVSLGSCSTYGGIQALGNLHTAAEVIQTVSQQIENPFTDAPCLIPRVEAIDKFIEVEFYVPGCPPSESVLNHALPYVLSGKEPELTKEHRHPVCAECGRKIEHRDFHGFKGITTPDAEICLLSQGYICLGSVTRSGCSSQCPDTNIPCSGCRGPTDSVLTKPTHTVLRDFVRRVSHFSGKSEQEVLEEITSLPWRFFPFTFGSEAMKRKPYSKVVELQAPVRKEEMNYE
jgi:F420-non-reducing hydrogenase small subunit